MFFCPTFDPTKWNVLKHLKVASKKVPFPIRDNLRHYQSIEISQNINFFVFDEEKEVQATVLDKLNNTGTLSQFKILEVVYSKEIDNRKKNKAKTPANSDNQSDVEIDQSQNKNDLSDENYDYNQYDLLNEYILKLRENSDENNRVS